MIVLGLDLSLSSTGIAVVKDELLLNTTVVPTKADQEWFHRIQAILREIQNKIESYNLDMVYIENYSFDAKFDRETLAEVHGVVMYFLHQKGIPFHKVSPTQVKQFATGKGRAPKCPEGVAKSTWGKRWVVEAVNKQYDEDFRLSENDKVDAFLVALLGYYVETARKTGNLNLDILDYQQNVVHNILFPSEKKKGGNKSGKGKDPTKSSGGK